MSLKIGVVGLGIMGRGMAINFLKHGFPVYVWNRTPSVADELVAQGATLMASPKEVASSADVIFEVTANDESSRAVWKSPDGILAGAEAKKILIASATLSVQWIDELIALCAQQGFQFCDIPLTGGRIGAETGTLTLLCGGDPTVIKGLQPVFDAIAKKVFYFGQAGRGMRYKLILNFMQALHIVGFGAAMKMAKAHHMDLEKVSEALVERPGGVITKIARDRYFNDADPISFSIEWIVKDLTYVKQYAAELDVPFLDDVLKIYSDALSHGSGHKDWASVNRLAR
ncbi:MAG: NAD(P)-dependent oxidoreductase [Candidatus Gottesmanbacteria bacterium]|nr:NAD(P)-dependent oxidoreductase [Candidatus Gottesmanbacteria bacterium]